MNISAPALMKAMAGVPYDLAMIGLATPPIDAQLAARNGIGGSAMAEVSTVEARLLAHRYILATVLGELRDRGKIIQELRQPVNVAATDDPALAAFRDEVEAITNLAING